MGLIFGSTVIANYSRCALMLYIAINGSADNCSTTVQIRTLQVRTCTSQKKISTDINVRGKALAMFRWSPPAGQSDL